MRITVHGISLAVHTWGKPENPAVFLIHGWLDTGSSFQWLAEFLQKDFYLIAPDMRGFGKSQASPSELGYFFFEYVADMMGLLDQMSPGKPVRLVGHSLGGAVASVLAGAFPERIHSLVNVEGFAFQRLKQRSGPTRVRDWYRGLPPSPFPQYDRFEDFMGNLAKRHPRIPADRLEQWARMLVEKTPEGFRTASDPKHKLIDPYDFSQERFHRFWEQYTFPSLFVTAGDSELAPALEEVTKTFPPNIETAEIPACAHMVHLEDPEALAKLLRGFYERIS